MDIYKSTLIYCLLITFLDKLFLTLLYGSWFLFPPSNFSHLHLQTQRLKFMPQNRKSQNKVVSFFCSTADNFLFLSMPSFSLIQFQTSAVT